MFKQRPSVRRLSRACTASSTSAAHQWFYFDSVESFPRRRPRRPSSSAPEGSRYGFADWRARQDHPAKIESQKIFLVGAGALGCEFIKNFALMGLSRSADGKVTVTDDDVIEKSNL